MLTAANLFWIDFLFLTVIFKIIVWFENVMSIWNTQDTSKIQLIMIIHLSQWKFGMNQSFSCGCFTKEKKIKIELVNCDLNLLLLENRMDHDQILYYFFCFIALSITVYGLLHYYFCCFHILFFSFSSADSINLITAVYNIKFLLSKIVIVSMYNCINPNGEK